MDHPFAHATRFIDCLLVASISANRFSTILREYELPIPFWQHRQRQLRQGNDVIEVGLVPSRWNDPGSISVKLCPSHLSRFATTCRRQQDEAEQGPVHWIITGRLPKRSQFVVAQHSCPCLLRSSRHSSDDGRAEVIA